MSQVVYTQEHNGRRVKVSQKDVIILRLAENPTTGFVWHLDFLDEKFFVCENSDYQLGSTAVGGGGIRRFTFRILQKGVTRLAVKNWREWEGDSSVRERCVLEIEITE